MHIDRGFRLDTIGDLRLCGARLEFVCGRCGASRAFDAQTLPFGNPQPVTTAHRRMRCSTCGWQGEDSRTRATYPESVSVAVALTRLQVSAQT